MKKVLATGLIAIALIASSQQQASAWVNARVGVNVNLGWQTGGNCFFWGLWQSGEYPGDSHHDHHFGYFVPPVPVPYIWVGHPHGHAAYPTPGPVDSFAMTPYQYPVYAQPTYYYYYPTTNYYGR
jgi:hypothetical protein